MWAFVILGAFMEWDKPFKTFDQQIEYLSQEYKLIINDKDSAKILLSSISYYDLINGYKECFMLNDKYDGKTSIEDLYYFLTFDRNIQSLLFKYSVYVENRFKTILAYVLSKHFDVDVDFYLDINNFQQNKGAIKKYIKLMNSVNMTLNSNYLDNPTKHYKDKKNHIPAWILLKNLSFNDCIDLFSILNKNVQEDVCDYLVGNKIDKSQRVQFVLNALIIVRKFRNKIAHNLKFITYKTPNSIILKNLSRLYGGNLIEREDFKIKRGRNDIYAMIISIITLLSEYHFIDKFYNDFILQIALREKFKDNFDIWETYCNKTNIPLNLLERIASLTIKMKNDPRYMGNSKL